MEENQKFLIREMKKADIEEVEKLHIAIFPVRYSKNVFIGFLRPDYLSLVIETEWYGEKRIIGVSTSSRNWASPFSRSRTAYLSTFGILPEFRRHHLGTLLLNATVACLAKYYGCIELSLHMEAANKAAYEFYISNKFIAVQLLPDHYTFNNSYHDAYFMRKPINTIELDRKNTIEYSKEVEYLAHNSQYISWFHRFCLDP
ncbi:acetyltransferase, GNAT family protein [Trichomonas vaginalis G3]|uniref:N-alpha-acetyltransferase 60 n=1 Tax=Trichomonas vaginalis (strain ATCC PRA-98 / G3) TaxID=412133 RepID=A2FCT0_TRIV3|nr:acetyltransferase (GNAT) domain-containing protein [Trichomonas vaginalis G3]EAX97304.1 acetyltransferase, GNAT family protein [Trichomonas vaginalis G3]KAI5518168.1 acetyltransferase (GNAT) domain-containing protein [Trichomonas vaginalis G3]|eukprot:XP_001310234.1 acetyltransferase, GNAT family protein [Trichomonas vaginalis G3]